MVVPAWLARLVRARWCGSTDTKPVAHFLSLDQFDHVFRAERRVAMVTADLVAKKRLQVQVGIAIAKADVKWYPLPPYMEVVAPDGALIRPSSGRSFFVTVETFNPFHGLTEAAPGDMR